MRTETIKLLLLLWCFYKSECCDCGLELNKSTDRISERRWICSSSKGQMCVNQLDEGHAEHTDVTQCFLFPGGSRAIKKKKKTSSCWCYVDCISSKLLRRLVWLVWSAGRYRNYTSRHWQSGKSTSILMKYRIHSATQTGPHELCVFVLPILKHSLNISLLALLLFCCCCCF